MPGIVSKNISSRQSGAITGGTMRVGNSKSGGSANRMVSHCKSNSENPSDCVNQIIGVARPSPPPPPPPKEEDFLFNLSSFDKIPFMAYKTALYFAANRWNNFIKYDMNTVKFIRSFEVDGINLKNWRGLELTGFYTGDIGNLIAQTETIVIDSSSFNISFTIKVNNSKFADLDQNDINNVFTHELGHALGFNYHSIRENGQSGGAEILPNIQTLKLFKIKMSDFSEKPLQPSGLFAAHFPTTVQYYYDIGGNCDNDNKTISESDMFKNSLYGLPLDDNISAGFHFTNKTYSSIERMTIPVNSGISKYYKRALGNEIMIPEITQGQKYYISPFFNNFFFSLLLYFLSQDLQFLEQNFAFILILLISFLQFLYRHILII
jgi:hypothetical protein